MSRYLFAWELGANLGHLTRLVPVARTLAKRGHEVLFATRDLGEGAETLMLNRLAYVAAPALAYERKAAEPILSYPDILAAHGFANPRKLNGVVGAWLGLFGAYQPDAVILDHAPAALLAVHLRKLPHLTLGTGFTLPPAMAPMPSMRPWAKDSPEALRAVESAVLANVNAAARHHQQRGFSHLHELFDPASSAICAFPELDHYGRRAGARYIGPTFVTDAGQPMRWRGKVGPKVFVYMRAASVIDALLRELAKVKADAILYAPGATEAQQRIAKEAGFQLTLHPARMDALLKEADLVVSAAGHGLLSAGPAAKRLGAALFLLPAHLGEKLGDALDKLLGGQPELRAGAKGFAARYTDYSQRKSQESLLALSLGLPPRQG